MVHPISPSLCPAIFLGFTSLGEIFAYDCFFFNPTIEVVTFCLCGWCKLDVFLLLAFTRLGHVCRDLLSPCDGMHVCTGLSISSERVLGDGVRTHVNSKGKPLYQRLRGPDLESQEPVCSLWSISSFAFLPSAVLPLFLSFCLTCPVTCIFSITLFNHNRSFKLWMW